MRLTQRFIVGEISKNWRDGQEGAPTGLICRQFEQLIAVNLDRGYRLHSFQLHRLMVGPRELNETIIAVFERVESDAVASPEAAP